MAMSKMDYEVIAALIVKAKEFHPDATEGLESLTMMLTGAFGASNKRFRSDLFLTAAEHSSVTPLSQESMDNTWAKFQQQLQENN